MTRYEHKSHLYRSPRDLRRPGSSPRRALIIGSCLSGGLVQAATAAGAAVEHIFFNNAADLPEKSEAELRSYDFQIAQIAVRSFMREHTYFRIKYDNEASYRDLFERCREGMRDLLDAAMRYHKAAGILTFVTNFLVPQRNPMGLLLPKYDLRNPVYFMSELNRALSEELANYRNSYILDVDEISATFGRRHAQDDGLWTIAHGSTIADFDSPNDQDRIEPPDAIEQYYDLRVSQFLAAVWREAEASFDVVRQTDNIKIVIVDLDYTLWRGVLAEMDEINIIDAIEGWPLGLIEALLFLKRRGVLLGLVSKNDPARIAEIWPRVLGDGILQLADFASTRINWRPKNENVGQVLREVNLLPGNALFLDDNPVEREAVSRAFPEIRTLGRDHYYWRRILLWAPELQVPTISQESARRTEMVQAQAEREEARGHLSRGEFIASLNIQIEMIVIDDVSATHFGRCFELINKTNQFNTSGKRWTDQECVDLFKRGGRFYAFSVKDRFSSHGLVAVGVTLDNTIGQFVMSCRVVGLDVEIAAIAAISGALGNAGASPVRALTMDTSANLLSRDLYSRCGFTQGAPGIWVKARNEVPP
jgi:FkbH-like protein